MRAPFRALLVGLLGGVLLSGLRAPLGIELLEVPAVDARLAVAYRAAALVLFAFALLFGGTRLEGPRALGGVVVGAAAGLLGHGLLSGRTPQTHPGAVLFALTLAGAMVLLARLGGPPQQGREATRGAGARVFPLAAAGAGAALALEGLARHLRLLGGGGADDDSVFAGVLALCLLAGMASLGPLARTARGARRAPWIVLAAGSAPLALVALNGFASPLGLDRYLERFGLDGSRVGMLDYDGLLAAAVWIAPGLALGALLRALDARAELAALLAGAAVGLLAVPWRLALEVAPDGGLLSSSTSTRIVFEGTGLMLAAAGVLLLGRGGRRWWTAILSAAAFTGAVASWRAEPNELPIARPWRRAPVVPSFHLDTPEGLVTIERSEGGLEVVTLEGRELTPPTSAAPGERRRLELSFELLPLEWRVRGVRVLLVGQLTPGRALAMRGLGASTIDRTGSWAAAMPVLERELFGETELPPGRILPLARARAALAAGRYDLVVVPDVAGDAPATSNLASPADTAVAVWLDASADLRQRHLGEVWVTTRDLVGLHLGIVHGGSREHLDPTVRGTPRAYPVGAVRRRGTPLARLLQRRFRREFTALQAVTERLAEGAPQGPARLFTEGLARHYAAQHHSSPFETPAERVELDPDALDLWSEAARAGVPDAALVDVLETLAAVLVGKRRPDTILAVLGPIAKVSWPWPALEDALAYAELELLEPSAAAARLERLVVEGFATPERLALLADARLQTRDPAGAAKALWRALELGPDDREVRRRLAIALARAGDPEAGPMLRDLLLEEPGDEELRLYLAPGPYPAVRGGYHPLHGALPGRHDGPREFAPGGEGR